MIRRFHARISNGKLADPSGVISRWVKGRKDGDCLITFATGVDAKERKRSTRQNAYYWGVVVEQYLHAMIDTGDGTIEEASRELRTETLADALHELLKFRFSGREVIDHDTGEIIRLPTATSRMNTQEIGVYWDKIRADALEKYGVDIPPPPDGVFEE
jgi:hypothetical protein